MRNSVTFCTNPVTSTGNHGKAVNAVILDMTGAFVWYSIPIYYQKLGLAASLIPSTAGQYPNGLTASDYKR